VAEVARRTHTHFELRTRAFLATALTTPDRASKIHELDGRAPTVDLDLAPMGDRADLKVRPYEAMEVLCAFH